METGRISYNFLIVSLFVYSFAIQYRNQSNIETVKKRLLHRRREIWNPYFHSYTTIEASSVLKKLKFPINFQPF